jgi:hypothetical protein
MPFNVSRDCKTHFSLLGTRKENIQEIGRGFKTVNHVHGMENVKREQGFYYQQFYSSSKILSVISSRT